MDGYVAVDMGMSVVAIRPHPSPTPTHHNHTGTTIQDIYSLPPRAIVALLSSNPLRFETWCPWKVLSRKAKEVIRYFVLLQILFNCFLCRDYVLASLKHASTMLWKDSSSLVWHQIPQIRADSVRRGQNIIRVDLRIQVNVGKSATQS